MIYRKCVTVRENQKGEPKRRARSGGTKRSARNTKIEMRAIWGKPEHSWPFRIAHRHSGFVDPTSFFSPEAKAKEHHRFSRNDLGARVLV